MPVSTSGPVNVRSAQSVQIEPMRRRHLRAVQRIEKQVYPTPWSLALYVQELAQDRRIYRVARVGGKVIGYGGMMLVAGEAHVSTMAVDPKWQRMGIASRIMLELAWASRDAEATSLTLEVRASNQAAQRLYGRFGFAPAGVRKNYYRQESEDAIIMWVHDVDSDDYGASLRQIESSL